MGVNSKKIRQDVKQLIIDIVNEEHEASLKAEHIRDEEEISVSPVLQMDSLMGIRLVVGLERVFGIEIPDEDLDMEYFKSVAAIAQYVEVKSGENACGK